MNALETYNMGNKHLNAGEFEAAVAAYSEVIEALPRFPLAYFNRAVARYRARAADASPTADDAWPPGLGRREVLDDLWMASALGYDEKLADALGEADFFRGIASYVVATGGYMTLFQWYEDDRLGEPVRERLLLELIIALESESYLLRQALEADILFNLDRLPARVVIGDILRQRVSGQPLLAKALAAFDAADELAENDPELGWRVSFLIGWMLYCKYQKTEFDGQGLVHDASFMDNLFLLPEEDMDYLETYVAAEVSECKGRTAEETSARFALELLFHAVEQLCDLRLDRMPPAGTAETHWDLANNLFKSLLATASLLEDADASHDAIASGKYFGAIVGVTGWLHGATGKRASRAAHRVLDAFACNSTSALTDSLGEHGLALEYGLYEVGTDRLVRVCHAARGSSVSEHGVDSNLVVALMMTSRQWEIPPSMRDSAADAKSDEALSKAAARQDAKLWTADALQTLVLNQSFKEPWRIANTENVSEDHALRRQLIASVAASSTVPLHGYPAVVDEVVIGDALRSQSPAPRRLVIFPFNYLHNLPWHLLPSIRAAIDAETLEEVVVAPSVKLLENCRARAPARRDRASVLFVGLDVGGSIDAEAELAAIRSAYPKAEALLGKQATGDRLLKAFGKFDVVHIACHGHFDRERNAAFLEMSGGRLYPADCAATSVKSDLIVLNACVSGVVSRESRSGDQVLSFPAALLAAGARQVIGALWEVEETVAVDFTSAFYTSWRRDERTTAQIVLDVQKSFRSLAGKSDPYYWGPHTVFGDWR